MYAWHNDFYTRFMNKENKICTFRTHLLEFFQVFINQNKLKKLYFEQHFHENLNCVKFHTTMVK